MLRDEQVHLATHAVQCPRNDAVAEGSTMSDSTDRTGQPRYRPAMTTPATGADAPPPPVELAAAVLRERWKAAIVLLVAAGHQRFSALQRQLPGATSKVLSEQLRDLVRDGVLSKWTATQGRRHVEYSLTRLGEGLVPALDQLEAWGREYAADQLSRGVRSGGGRPSAA